MYQVMEDSGNSNSGSGSDAKRRFSDGFVFNEAISGVIFPDEIVDVSETADSIFGVKPEEEKSEKKRKGRFFRQYSRDDSNVQNTQEQQEQQAQQAQYQAQPDFSAVQNAANIQGESNVRNDENIQDANESAIVEDEVVEAQFVDDLEDAQSSDYASDSDFEEEAVVVDIEQDEYENDSDSHIANLRGKNSIESNDSALAIEAYSAQTESAPHSEAESSKGQIAEQSEEYDAVQIEEQDKNAAEITPGDADETASEQAVQNAVENAVVLEELPEEETEQPQQEKPVSDLFPSFDQIPDNLPSNESENGENSGKAESQTAEYAQFETSDETDNAFAESSDTETGAKVNAKDDSDVDSFARSNKESSDVQKSEEADSSPTISNFALALQGNNKKQSRRIKIMRKIVAPIFAVCAFVLLAVGILNITVWKPSKNVSVSLKSVGTRYAFVDSHVLSLLDSSVSVTVSSENTGTEVCIASASRSDAQAWAKLSGYTSIDGLNSWDSLKSSEVRSQDSSALQNAVAFKDSDLWRTIECSATTVSFTNYRVEANSALLIDTAAAAQVTESNAKSNAKITLQWQREQLPDYGTPLFFAAGIATVLAILAATVFAMEVKHNQQKKGFRALLHSDLGSRSAKGSGRHSIGSVAESIISDDEDSNNSNAQEGAGSSSAEEQIPIGQVTGQYSVKDLHEYFVRFNEENPDAINAETLQTESGSAESDNNVAGDAKIAESQPGSDNAISDNSASDNTTSDDTASDDAVPDDAAPDNSKPANAETANDIENTGEEK